MSAEPTPEVPAFSNAIQQLKDFLLAGQNISTDLLWVFREDVVSYKLRLYVREPLPGGNERLVESLYERGLRRDLGIRLNVLCLLGSRPCCYIWLPKDREDAGYALLLMSRFIIGSPSDMLRARSVKNRLAWRAYKLLDEKFGWRDRADRVPHRNIQRLPSAARAGD
jgi:hypothetical protein